MDHSEGHHGGMATGMDAFGPAEEFTLPTSGGCFEWRDSQRTAFQPDVLVALRDELLAVDGQVCAG